MTGFTLPEIARALRGQIVGRRQVLAPGPHHSAKDRSMAVWLCSSSPVGIRVHSHAGDDWRACLDHTMACLGMPRFDARRADQPDQADLERRRQLREYAAQEEAKAKADGERRARKRLSEGARPLRGGVVDRYLRNRSIDLPEHMAGTSILYHDRCPWLNEAGELVYVHAMLCPLTSLTTGEVVGCHRTGLTPEGEKIGRKVLGTAEGCVIQLEPAARSLAVGEGVESALSARQIGFGPVWAAYSATEISRFPIIDGVQSLVLLGERDKKGTNSRAVERCGERWHTAGRAVQVAMPIGDYDDFNSQVCGVKA